MKRKNFLRMSVLTALLLAGLTACGDDTESDGGGNNTANNANSVNNTTNNSTENNVNNVNNENNVNNVNNENNVNNVNNENNVNNVNNENNVNNVNNNGNCAEDAFSPNHDPNQAAAAELGGEYAGTICPGVADWYAIDLEAGQKVVIATAFDGTAGDLDLEVYAAADPETVLGSSAGTADAETINFEAPEAGTYIVRVFGFQDAAGDYTLTLDAGCSVDADCSEGQACDPRLGACVEYADPACGEDGQYDPNGSDSRAVAVTESQTFTGLGTCEEDLDFFRVTLGAGHSLEVEAVPDAGAVAIFGLNAEGAVFAQSGPREQDGVEALALPHMAAGDYFVAVISGDGATSYDLQFAISTTPCAANADCALSPVGPFCQEGVCGTLEGNGEVPPAGLCDSDDDCAGEEVTCSTDARTADSFYCTSFCGSDADCGDIGEDGYCDQGTGVCRPACVSDDNCSADTICRPNGQCGQCFSDTDCAGREGQVCVLGIGSVGGTCASVPAPECGDDANEPNNSSGAATLVTLTEGEASFTGLNTCTTDTDIFVVELMEPGTLAVTTTFDGSDLDIIVSAEGSDTFIGLGVSEETDGESARAEYVPAGRYFVRLAQYELDGGPADTDYDIEFAVTAGGCESDDQCLQTSVRRLTCDAGACVPLDGAGQVAPGGTCDSSDDCDIEQSALCLNVEAGTEPNNYCAPYCETDEDCAGVPDTACAAVDPFGFTFACVPASLLEQ